MHGNVWEWCLDRHEKYPSKSVTDPSGPSSGPHRVFRGGGWGDDASRCRSANRFDSSPEYAIYGLGFRPIVLQK